ncbi:SMP-30/gluconolactonase/LRE family protein [Pararhizobium haloflavum]|uniref:SMP-30/gluconolactonase/LRE family protein n=1 Tax=Pararhizobium haloflavum TaxID=2037914 RepID=UPI001FDF5C7D|nr:SMP-30/gluconolactonase/LRE family protein [Pararhizobium haloflavum]
MQADDMSAVALAGDRHVLGEGPTYDPDTDTAYWFDIVGKKLIEHSFADNRQRTHDLPFMASVLASVDDKRQLLAAEDGLYLRDRESGRLTLHIALEADNHTTRSNDGRVHPSGALWIGTMGKRAEKKAGAIYWYRDGEIRLLFPEIGIPNAICFSPDGRIGYFADTQIDTIFRAELDPETGLPLGAPQVFLKPGHDAGAPDGAVVDRYGALWCARWGGHCISAYDPHGRHLASLPVPASQPSCPAFVGRDADRLIVTSAMQGLDAKALQGEPGAGRTFLLDHPVEGQHAPRVRL